MKTIGLIFVLLIPSFLYGQGKPVTITGTVTDPNGNPYSDGTVSAQLILGSGAPPPAGVPRSSGPSPLNGIGFFSIPLFAINDYQFTICGTPVSLGPLGNGTPTQICFNSETININTDGQDVTDSLTAFIKVIGPKFSAVSVVRAQDQQVLYASQGVSTGSQIRYNPLTGDAIFPAKATIGDPSVAGSYLLGNGPLPLPIANADGWASPPAVNPFGIVRLTSGTPGGGLLQGFPGQIPGGGFFVKYGSSGDSNHSTGRIPGATSAIPLTIVCSFSYCQSGGFEIVVNVSSSVACQNPGSAAVQFFVTFTDDVGTATIPIPMSVNGSPTFTATMGLGNTTNKASGSWKFNNVLGSNIFITSTYVPCNAGTGGPATYNYDVEVIEHL